MHRNSRWPGVALALAGLGALLWLERKRPLRKPVAPGPARIVCNVAIGAITAASVVAIERPIVQGTAALTARGRWGLLGRIRAPAPVKTALALALMDYTLYWWHVLLHRVPVLWRLHEPHHIDHDLDTSTAVRFHFTEFLASIPWRCAQVVAIGVSPRALQLWQTLTFAEVLFHHSNTRLPRATERALSVLVVTPRLHGIHHSVVRAERDSNFSSGLTLWDAVHGTLRRDLDRDHVQIGVPGHARAEDVSLPRTLALPFRDPERARRKAAGVQA